MMTGSCVMDQDYWSQTVTILIDTVAKLRHELGIEFEFVNLGGGLGIPYHPDDKPVDIDSISKMLRQLFDDAKVKHNLSQLPQLCMENGRYMTGPFGWLITRCQAIKESYGRYYGVDACMANLMRPGMYNSYHHITIPVRENIAERSPSHVVGTLCENNDWFAKNRSLPKAQVGDLFVIYDTGAHAHSMGFQYNGKLRAPEVLILRDNTPFVMYVLEELDGAGLVLITMCRRERETYEALYGNCVLPPGL